MKHVLLLSLYLFCLNFVLAEENPKPTKELESFKDRVEAFWGWYQKRGDFFYQQLDLGNALEISDEVGDKIQELLPDFAWVFGPGVDGGHSLTLSAEGQPDRQKLTEYWLSRAPEMKGWTFHAYRQAGLMDGYLIKLGEHQFDAGEVLVKVEPNDEASGFELTIWHPFFSKVDEQTHYTLASLWLDESVGEQAATNWIKSLDIAKRKPKKAIKLSELNPYFDKVIAEREWKSGGWSIYKMNPDESGKLRTDVYLGITNTFGPLNDYFEKMKPAPGKADSFKGLGAHYVYLAVDIGNVSNSIKPLDFRNKLSDEIEVELAKEHAGSIIGGASGHNYIYIDLLLYDKQLAIELIEKHLEKRKLKIPATLQPFYRSFGPAKKFN